MAGYRRRCGVSRDCKHQPRWHVAETTPHTKLISTFTCQTQGDGLYYWSASTNTWDIHVSTPTEELKCTDHLLFKASKFKPILPCVPTLQTAYWFHIGRWIRSESIWLTGDALRVRCFSSRCVESGVTRIDWGIKRRLSKVGRDGEEGRRVLRYKKDWRQVG